MHDDCLRGSSQRSGPCVGQAAEHSKRPSRIERNGASFCIIPHSVGPSQSCLCHLACLTEESYIHIPSIAYTRLRRQACNSADLRSLNFLFVVTSACKVQDSHHPFPQTPKSRPPSSNVVASLCRLPANLLRPCLSIIQSGDWKTRPLLPQGPSYLAFLHASFLVFHSRWSSGLEPSPQPSFTRPPAYLTRSRPTTPRFLHSRVLFLLCTRRLFLPASLREPFDVAAATAALRILAGRSPSHSRSFTPV